MDNNYDSYSGDNSDSDSEITGYSSTKPGVILCRKNRLSSNAFSSILNTLSSNGYKVLNPSQSGVWRANVTAGNKLKEEYKNTLFNDDWSLYFDGKRLEEKHRGVSKIVEHQVMVLKNSDREIRLAAFKLNDGKSNTIFSEIKRVLIKYNLIRSMQCEYGCFQRSCLSTR